MRTLALPIALLAACASRGSTPAAMPEPTWSRGAVYAGMCDASAATVAGDRFLVADDEDNLIRVYRTGVGGPPVQVIDPAPFMTLDPSSPEADLEASAVIGDRIYWLSSHGRSKSGKWRASRLQFFATRVVAGERMELEPVGRPYTRLLEDLARLGFGDRVNLEGLAATPDGRLLIGFRSPTPRGKALVVPLENPAEVIAGAAPRLGPAILVDLGGRGVRSMEAAGDGYVIAAGAPGEERRPGLFLWDGAAEVRPLDEDLGDFNPEALFVDERTRTVQLFSDDGTVSLGGRACKKARPAEHRRFRGLAVELRAAW